MKLRKTLCLLAALTMVACCFAGCGKSNKVLVATNAEFEPFEYFNDKKEMVGADIDIINKIADKSGFTVEMKHMDFDGVIAAVESGSCDAAISGLTINPKREKSVNFSTPYYESAQMLIVRQDDTAFTGTTKAELDEQLKNKTIGVCKGFTGQYYVEGDADWGYTTIEGATAKPYDNVSLASEDLKNSKVDVIIMDEATAKSCVAADTNKGKLRVIDVALTVEKYAIAVNKDKTELLKQINDALAKMEENGELKTIVETWEIEKSVSAGVE